MGSGATPLTTQDLFFGDAISIPIAPTNHLPDWSGLLTTGTRQIIREKFASKQAG
jgi:hypothetical protein